MSPALHLKPNKSSPPLEVWLQLSLLTRQDIYHSSARGTHSAAAKTSARSEMSGIVAAACCVYFLLPSVCFCSSVMPPGDPAPRMPPRDTSPSLKCSVDGRFVQHDNERLLTPQAS